MKKMAKKEAAKVVDEDFSSVFEIITRRRNRALMAVNVELLMTYWEIGAFLSPRIHAGSWDAAVVGRLADYLKRQDPTLRGYGKSNLYSMALVYETFSSDAFLALVEKYHGKLRQQDFFQPLAGKSLIPAGKTEAANIFQPVVGKCLPPILAVLSFGIILCKSANKIVVEYAMSRTMSPVMVAQYKRQLIPKEVLQRTFEEYLALPETIEG